MFKIDFLKTIVSLMFLIISIKSIAQVTIIQNGDEWEYYDNGYLKKDWINHPENYTWKKGITPIGYGDAIIKTEINFGGDYKNKHLVKYFKKEIYISESNFLGFETRLLRDDGAIIYVNGKELFRSNMDNTVINNTFIPKSTVDGANEEIYFVDVFPNYIFKKGKNIILVAVYQSYAASSDCIFSLELIGHNSSEILNKLVSNKNELNEELKLNIKDLEAKFEFEKLYYKSESLKETNYNLKILILVVVIIFIFTLVFIYSLLENKRKQSNKHELESLFLKEKNLDKDKEMLVLNTKILKSKQYFKEIKADLKGLKTEDKSTLKMIISDIDEILANTDEWTNLQNHFNAVYEGFYERLINNHPDLTETELRHCVFIKLHLQTKEIARILLIDPRSVQTTRYRIKKKMNLGENIDIRNYLLKI